MSPTTSKFVLFSSLVILLLLAGCEGADESIPAYIEVQPFELNTDYTTQGSDSEKIIDGWVYIGTEFLGAYELPATIPILKEGSQDLVIFPGIKVNGFAALPEINNFYNRYEETLNLESETITPVQPVTNYKDVTVIPFIENFDANHLLDEEEDGNPNSFVNLVSGAEAFENSSGFIFLDVDNPNIEVATSIRFEELPINRSTVYLELDYKTDVQFAVGLIGHADNIPESKNYIIVLNPQEEWNKIYIDLTDNLADSAFEEYQLVFNAILPFNADGGFSQTEGRIYLDNMKIVHFEQ